MCLAHQTFFDNWDVQDKSHSQVNQTFEIAPIDVAGNLDYKALCYIITHGQEEE